MRLTVDKNHYSIKKEHNRGADYEIEDVSIQVSYVPEQIRNTVREENAPYDMFKKMRSIGGSQHSFFYGTDAKKFVKQAKFMETFTDDQQQKVLFEQQYPSYDELSDAQLRTYFTWRTKVRSGVVEETAHAFVLLYIYELINNIGVKNGLDGIGKLIFFWKSYMPFDHQMDRYLVQWIKDYYICNHFHVSFQEIVSEYGLERYYPNLFLDHHVDSYTFERLSGMASYQFKESKFYTANNELILADCFHNVILNLIPLLEVYGTNWDGIILGAMENSTWWRPFRSAVYVDLTTESRTVYVSAYERYVFENGSWTAYKPQENTTAAGLIFGYIIKRIEANLRMFTGHKRKLNPNRAALISMLQKTYGAVWQLVVILADPLFDSVIDDTSAACFTPEVELVSISEKLEDGFRKAPYPLLKEMRTAACLEKVSDPAQRFCIQAKMAAEAEDHRPEVISFEETVPTYDNMTNQQLRCYFTWRTSVRNGEFYQVPSAYVRLYIFELINNVGVEDELDAVKKMADILLHERELDKSTQKSLRNWLKEYYVCGNFSCSFYDVIRECNIEPYYPNVALEFSDTPRFEIFSKMAHYKIEKSKFYNGTMKSIAEGCLHPVIDSVTAYFDEQGLNFKQILIGNGVPVNWWRPFHQAIRYQNKIPKFGSVILCSNETYTCKHGLWDIVTLPEKNMIGTYLLGYVIKRMEESLRAVTNYKYRFSADIGMVVTKLSYRDQKIEKAILEPCFDQTIEDAVFDYLKKEHPEVFEKPQALSEKHIEHVEMTLDMSKFEKIRAEAEKTREKLTTEDLEEESSGILVFPEAESDGIAILPEAQKTYPLREIGDSSVPASIMDSRPEEENPWQALYTALTALQIEAIKTILDDARVGSALLHLSQQNKILPEVLMEGINEIALEYIGDTIIDTAEGMPYIYEDYLEKTKDTFGGI